MRLSGAKKIADIDVWVRVDWLFVLRTTAFLKEGEIELVFLLRTSWLRWAVQVLLLLFGASNGWFVHDLIILVEE